MTKQEKEKDIALPAELHPLFDEVKSGYYRLHSSVDGSKLAPFDMQFSEYSTSRFLLNSVSTSLDIIRELPLLRIEEPDPSFADIALLRSAAEVACVAHWVLIGTSVDVINARRVAVLVESNKKHLAYSKTVGVDDTTARIIRVTGSVIRSMEHFLRDSAGVNVPKMPTITALITESDSYRINSGSNHSPMLPIWQLGSGFAHGKDWVLKHAVERVPVRGTRDWLHLKVRPVTAIAALREILLVTAENMKVIEQLCAPPAQGASFFKAPASQTRESFELPSAFISHLTQQENRKM